MMRVNPDRCKKPHLRSVWRCAASNRAHVRPGSQGTIGGELQCANPTPNHSHGVGMASTLGWCVTWPPCEGFLVQMKNLGVNVVSFLYPLCKSYRMCPLTLRIHGCHWDARGLGEQNGSCAFYGAGVPALERLYFPGSDVEVSLLWSSHVPVSRCNQSQLSETH